MSELTNPIVKSFRNTLLTTASSFVVLTNACGVSDALADDRPTVWVEFGGQLERIDAGQAPFSPDFATGLVSDADFSSPMQVQRPPRYSNGAEGEISFRPAGTDWTFTAAIRFGRSNASRRLHEQKVVQTVIVTPSGGGGTQFTNLDYSNATARLDVSHTVLDFQVGKDIGIGLFGDRGSSILAFGARFAQFTSKRSATLNAKPDFQFDLKYLPGRGTFPLLNHYHDYAARSETDQSFGGTGPSVSWKASIPVAQNADAGEVSIDWGANAAILFGRQKISGFHQTTAYFKRQILGGQPLSTAVVYQSRIPVNRSRSIIVPNIGAFAGASFKYVNAKISLGYRADFFFGAIDGGTDARRSYDRNFYGPFAAISIGLGG